MGRRRVAARLLLAQHETQGGWYTLPVQGPCCLGYRVADFLWAGRLLMCAVYRQDPW
jgi:hypothetical protein